MTSTRTTFTGLLVAFALLAFGASPALAASSYVFDPQLSLTGGCATDGVDPVADPSCPYQAFPDGPSEPFNGPAGVTIDPYGNVYVAVRGADSPIPGHIDVFDSGGHFITELALTEPNNPGYWLKPSSIAVDGNGYLYVSATGSAAPRLQRYDPALYNPAAGEISYGTSPTLLPQGDTGRASLTINPQNDRLFAHFGTSRNVVGDPNHPESRLAIVEFGSAEEGNPLLDRKVAEAHNFGGNGGLAIDAARGRLYATETVSESPLTPRIIRVFELAPPHNLIETIDGSTTPEGSFLATNRLPLAVDEATGDLFAFDSEKLNVIYQLSEDGQYLSSIEGSLYGAFDGRLVIDNGEFSPNGALNGEGRYLWATASPGGLGHAFAFEPRSECPPAVESLSVSHVTETEALLRAEIEPCNLETTYRFEYVTEQQFAETGFEGASLVGEGAIPAGGALVTVSAGATGLSPGTSHRFRAVATNGLGEDEAQGAFKTYPTSPPSSACPNEALRSGPSALLPDCRAYELVTPANTNGLIPFGGGFLGPLFLSRTASPAGDGVFFRIEGGIIPGADGTGSLQGDPYLSTREQEGWSTVGTGGKGSEFVAAEAGGRSPDLEFSVWRGVVNGQGTKYLRFPDGHSEPLAQGSLGIDPGAQPDWVSEGGAHLIFSTGGTGSSAPQLEPEAPPSGKGAVYDRTPADGTTHVASLLPGNETPTQAAIFKGASQDGRGIAFQIGSKLYLRYQNEETYEIGEGLTYEGIAEGGRRLFYLDEGRLYAFDRDQGTIPLAASGEPTVANVSPDGSSAYLVSTAKLTASPNPLGDKAKAGQQNLYLSREGQVSFVGILTEADVSGEGVNIEINGLGLWSKYIQGRTIGALPNDPSRTSNDGSVLLFQSTASLTGYDNAGHTEIYRFDAAAQTLDCISCNPTGVSAVADDLLQSVVLGLEDFPTTINDRVENLTADGRRAFFESTEALVAADIDGLRDVYQWEAEGLGSCTQAGGCLYLVSSGRSAQHDYLYGVSEDGDDVFIQTNDLLLADDPDETRSIYDARVGGGFPPPQGPAGECLGEACQPVVSAPNDPTPASSAFRGAGNVASQKARSRRCRKGSRAVRKGGRIRCVAKKRGTKRRTGRRSGANGRAAR